MPKKIPCLKRKNEDVIDRKTRKCSLKSLSFLDDLDEPHQSMTSPLLCKNVSAETLFDDFANDSQMDLICDAFNCDQEEIVLTQREFNKESKEQRSNNQKPEIANQGFAQNQLIWPDDSDLFLDHNMLAYTTPLKVAFTEKENDKTLDENDCQDFKLSNNLLNDSLFQNVDLSLLEKNCIAINNDVKARSIDTTNSPKLDSNINKELKENLKLCENIVVVPMATSTPNAVKSAGSFASRLKKRLVENAHKTPQSSSKLMVQSVVANDANTSKNEKTKEYERVQLVIEDLSTQDVGPFYGLPSKVKKLLEDLRGIKSLYDWQHDCLTQDEVKMGKNLIYSLPTSGGKTLVAEILILKAILCRKKDAILMLPYVAIVQEKKIVINTEVNLGDWPHLICCCIAYTLQRKEMKKEMSSIHNSLQCLSQFGVELGFLLEEYAGSKGRFPPRRRRKRNVLYVCTIEKANSLVNSLIETDRLDEISLIVVDELHMIGEGGRRGACIETMLTKVLHSSASIQIIAMSATLGNTDELASFLQAKIYRNDFRPVALDEYVKVMSSLYKLDATKLHPDDRLVKDRSISYQSKDMAAKDTDHLASLVMEVVPDHSCLIFCPTKKNCENVAVMICKALPKKLLKRCQREKQEVAQALQSSGGAVCPILWKTIPFGVAYHHGGLTTDERRIIEEAYRGEVLSVITCTSTLAAGVNLPARRVIIRSPHIGRSFLSRAQYKQMIGRAGRAGIDTKGESYLIVANPEDQARVCELVVGPMETCVSSLMYDRGKGFQALLLNLIGLKTIRNTGDAIGFFSRTLFSRQLARIKKSHPDLFQDLVASDDASNEVTIEKIAQHSIRFLMDLNLIESLPEDKLSFQPTKLGIATYKGGVDLSISNNLYKDLKHALETLVLDSYLHLLYLVTPYETTVHISPNWLIYMSEMNRLSPTELSAANLIGVPEHYIARKASGHNPRKKKVDEVVVRRFYITLMLFELFKGRSVWEVSARYEQPRGFLQNLLSSAAAFTSCVLHFTKEFEEFWPFHALLEKLIQVLQYCTVAELVPLMEIPSVKQARAKQLYKAGYKTLAHIANAECNSLVKDIEYLSRKHALQIIASAKILLTEKVESLQEEAEALTRIAS